MTGHRKSQIEQLLPWNFEAKVSYVRLLYRLRKTTIYRRNGIFMETSLPTSRYLRAPTAQNQISNPRIYHRKWCISVLRVSILPFKRSVVIVRAREGFCRSALSS
ncbi:MAG TPA: hypothetical protein DCS80_09220 [Betaproteobacteria bacterium]|nr:hypothetical protein [Betaproteobacteria bacterium]